MKRDSVATPSSIYSPYNNVVFRSLLIMSRIFKFNISRFYLFFTLPVRQLLWVQLKSCTMLQIFHEQAVTYVESSLVNDGRLCCSELRNYSIDLSGTNRKCDHRRIDMCVRVFVCVHECVCVFMERTREHTLY